MRKLLPLVVLLFFLIPFLSFPPQAYAFTCNFSVITEPHSDVPDEIPAGAQTMTATLNPQAEMVAGEYFFAVNNKFIMQRRFDNVNPLKLPTIDSQGGLSLSPQGVFNPGSTYTLGVYTSKNSPPVCEKKYTVESNFAASNCKITVTPDPVSTTDELQVTITGFKDHIINHPAGFHIDLHRETDPSQGKEDGRNADSASRVDGTYNFGRRPANTYSVFVKRGCDARTGGDCDFRTPLCAQTFCVGVTTDGKNSCGESSAVFTPGNITFIGQDGNVINAPIIPCASGEYNPETQNCSSVPTGLGINLGTNASTFAATIMGLFLALGGVILVLIIIVTGYRLMASQGDPEKVKAAREQLTGAIAGLVFMIFSIAILSFIGVDLLHIPGFNP